MYIRATTSEPLVGSTVQKMMRWHKTSDRCTRYSHTELSSGLSLASKVHLGSLAQLHFRNNVVRATFSRALRNTAIKRQTHDFMNQIVGLLQMRTTTVSEEII